MYNRPEFFIYFVKRMKIENKTDDIFYKNKN